MAFLSKSASAAVTSNATGGGYLSLSKIPDGGSVRFALLTDEPLEFASHAKLGSMAFPEEEITDDDQAIRK